jgi:hypothetical protein
MVEIEGMTGDEAEQRLSAGKRKGTV